MSKSRKQINPSDVVWAILSKKMQPADKASLKKLTVHDATKKNNAKGLYWNIQM